MAQKILIVEDEGSIADTLVYALNTEGFDVTWCATSGDALDSFQENSFDLIVLDVGLPDRDGFELCKDIRKTSDIPIIFLTARSSEVDRIVGLEIGGDDYVAKPFSPREVAARVKAVLRRTSGNSVTDEPANHDSLFSIDPQRMQIAFAGELLELSRYEYRILEVLLRHPGWVYSREKLMDLVWESPASSSDRTVDTHVKTLRAKLRAIKPDFDPIQTHRGVGYSLRDTV